MEIENKRPPQDAAKEAAGVAAASLIEDGMMVGLGTGSTTAYAIAEIGRRIREDGIRVAGVPTSFAAEQLAYKYQIPIRSLDNIRRLDVAIDGADEVDPEFRLIKGRGAAHTREKVVATQADRFVVLVDDSKIVDQLGSRMPLPVEILPMAIGPIKRAFEALDGVPTLRMGTQKDGPVISDQGLWILDVQFDVIVDPEKLNADILAMPGVLDHGLFIGIATDVIVGSPGGTARHLK